MPGELQDVRWWRGREKRVDGLNVEEGCLDGGLGMEVEFGFGFGLGLALWVDPVEWMV